jgi:sugar phosphate isomerase/epimerase
MDTLSRRELVRLAATGLASLAVPAPFAYSAAKVNSTVNGVKLGLITGSLGPVPAGKDAIDWVIAQCLDLRAAHVELVGGLLEPRLVGGAVGNQMPATITPEYEQSRAALRQWRISTPLALFAGVRRRFDQAGLDLMSYVMTVSDDFTDPELDAVFKQMRALGVKLFTTNQTRVHMGERMVPFARRYLISPAFHTHAASDNPDEVASVASLDRLLAMSPHFMVNLDIGHFTAGNNDAVAYIREHHDRITHLHIKDRQRNNGPNVVWGTGDTPIRECLQLLRDRKYPIACLIERENRDATGTPLEETRKCLEYMRQALA